MAKNRFFVLAAVLFNCSISFSVACAEDRGGVKTIGKYLGKLNRYVKYSNGYVPVKIGDADIETDELYKLRPFNINMEILSGIARKISDMSSPDGWPLPDKTGKYV